MEKVIILGSGPAGLTAGIYCARAGLNPLIISGNSPGGQLMITTEVENYPGFPEGITGPELIENMTQQAKNCGCRFLERSVSKISTFSSKGEKEEQKGEQKEILLDNGEKLGCETIIIATGASAKWLNLENEEKFRNNGISACATCDGPLKVFRNKPLAVVGGGEVAIEEATFLTKFASKVTIIHRRDTFRASKAMSDKVFKLQKEEKIDIIWDTTIQEYLSSDGVLSGLKLQNVKTNETSTLEIAGLFMAIGHNPNTDFLPDELKDQGGYLKVKNNVYTDVPGVFAAGDVHDIIYRQAITAAGFGCMAAIACERYLH